MIIRHTIKNQLQAIDFWLKISITSFISSLIIFIIEKNNTFLIIAFGVPFLIGVPVFYLHIEYLLFGRYKKIVVSFQEKKLTIFYKDEIKSYSFKEIEKIVVYGTRTLYKGRIQFMFYEDYNFLIIHLKDKSQIVITCLMVYPITLLLRQFEDIQIIKKKMVYPSILLRKLSWQIK